MLLFKLSTLCPWPHLCDLQLNGITGLGIFLLIILLKLEDARGI